MTFDDYQARAKTTSTLDPKSVTTPYYFGLGLTGEAGEIAEKLKKVIRNHDNDMSKLDVDDFKKELGDVLWYLAMLSSQVGLSFEDVAQTNLAKLADRKARGVIKSTGDNR
jgi:NTP pyrophosphatase (non-canonical NTP hydrolase)